MDLLRGLKYNFQGLRLGLTTGRLLFWGLLRFALVLIVMIVLTSFIIAYQARAMELLWSKPQSMWILWLWHLLSWCLSLFLVAVSTLFAYLLSQILFSVLIMDHMSKLTERKMRGPQLEDNKAPLWMTLLYLIRQEIPRTILPLLISFSVMLVGWLTPLAPLLAIVSAAVTIVFLSWDNTDLVPARRMVPFRTRFGFLMSTLPFHLGFGLPFLIPGLNILFLAFAPVGATLYNLDRDPPRGEKGETQRSRV